LSASLVLSLAEAVVMPVMEKHISCRISRGLIAFLRRHHGEEGVETVLSGLVGNPEFLVLDHHDPARPVPVEIRHLTDPSYWMSNEFSLRVLTNVKRVVAGPDPMFEAGQQMAVEELSKGSLFVARLLGTQGMARQATRINSRLNRIRTLEILELSRGRIRMAQHTKPGYVISPDICRWNLGIYCGGARLAGAEDVQGVQTQCLAEGADHCEFVITYREPGLANRLTRWALGYGIPDFVAEYEQTTLERDRLIEELTRSREAYRELAELSLAGSYVLSGGVIVYANRRMGELLGVPPGELLQRPLTDFALPEDRPRVETFLVKASTGRGTETPAEFRVDGPDGSLRHLQHLAAPIEHQGQPAILGNLVDVTQAKEAENALVESATRYRTLFENANDAIFIMRRGVFVECNPQTVSMYGRKRGDILGKHPWDLSPPVQPAGQDSRKAAMARISAAEAGQAQFFEWRHSRGDGSFFEAEVSLNRMEISGEVSVQAMVRDITQRKRDQAALAASEAKYRAILENMEEAYFEMDLAGRFVFFNDAVCRISGYSRKELLSMGNRDLATENTAQKMLEDFSELIKTGKTANLVDYEITTKIGDVREIELSASVRHDAEGRPVGFSGVVRDVTERRRVEAALAESERRYRALVENAPDMIATTDDKGRLTSINEPGLKILGRTRKEVLGKTLISLVAPRDRDAAQNAFSGLFSGQEPENPSRYLRVRMTGKDGERWVAFSGGPAPSGSGGPGIMVVGRDVTRRVAMEAHLSQARKMEAVGTLAGGIAHDFNNLLMGISGRAALMGLDIPGDHPHAEHLKAIEESVTSAASLTRQLLVFARGGSFEVRPLDIRTVAEKTLRMFGRAKKELEIEGSFPEDVKAVQADRSQIEQVLMNLFVNAWQAMPGGGRITVRAENETLSPELDRPGDLPPGEYVRITVTDTGVGMSEKIRQRVFDPFFTTKELGRGTGLGLASAYGIIHSHGGTITVESEKGKGASFFLHLPATDQMPEAEDAEDREVALGTETVLLVDDEAMVRDTASGMLKALGYRVLMANGALRAAEVYREHQDEISLVVLDMIMPGMDGGQAFDLIHEINPHVRVLLSSGYSLDGRAEDIMAKGCRGFIQKPFTLKRLSEEMRKVLDAPEGKGEKGQGKKPQDGSRALKDGEPEKGG